MSLRAIEELQTSAVFSAKQSYITHNLKRREVCLWGFITMKL
jgi:hypothetical protein